MSERTRFEHLEMEERPRRRTAPRQKTTERAEVRAVSAAPPGATFTPSALLEPILQNTLAPAGRTEFHYLYDQIAGVAGLVDSLGGGGGASSIELNLLDDVNVTNLMDGDILVWDDTAGEWVNQQPGSGGGASLSVANTWTAVQTFCVDDTANNAVSRAVTICHTSSNDLAAAGIGAGVNFAVESTLGGANVTLAQIDAQSSALGSGPGAETGRLLVNLASAGVISNELLFAPQQFTITRSPLASSTRSLVQIGAGPWHFGGGTPGGNLTHGNAQGNLLGLNQTAGYTGLLMAAGVGGVPRVILAGSGSHNLRVYDTTTAGESPALELDHRLSSGTATVGHGTALDLYAQNAAGSRLLHGSVWTQTEDISAGVEEIGLVFSSRVAGTFGERARFAGDTGNLNVLADIASQTGLNVGSLVSRGARADILGGDEAAPLAADYRALRVRSGALTGIPTGGVPNDILFDFGSTHQLATENRAAAYNVQVLAPSWTAVGASQIDIAATLQLAVPLAGANVTIPERYSLHCSGPIKIEAAVNGFVFTLPSDPTDPTGQAVFGRVPVNINNVIKYIALYDAP